MCLLLHDSFACLGGNITGKVLSVHAPNHFTQSWRAPTWPEGHYGKLTVTLDQGSASTKLSIELDGVPSEYLVLRGECESLPNRQT